MPRTHSSNLHELTPKCHERTHWSEYQQGVAVPRTNANWDAISLLNVTHSLNATNSLLEFPRTLISMSRTNSSVYLQPIEAEHPNVAAVPRERTQIEILLRIGETYTPFQQRYVMWRGGGLGSRPKKMYWERLGDGVEYHLMSPTPRR